VREFVGKKKQVVRPVRNSLQVREVVGEVISPGGSPTTAISALRIPDLACC
jgi:hypothetical protein